MADRIEWYDVKIPAGTPLATPVVIPLVFLQGNVVEIDVKVLDGPCGSVGFQIGAGGTQYIPNTIGNFIRPNDDYFAWPISNAINSGSWHLAGYNLDAWDHNIQVGFQINELGVAPGLTTSGLGTSAETAMSVATAVAPSAIAPLDPLSPDAILFMANPGTQDFLAAQLPVTPVQGVMSDAGAS
jgi:hypothetical protein